MTPQTGALILALLQLATVAEPLVLQQVQKIRAMLQQSPDVHANLEKLAKDAVTDDEDTLKYANDWLIEHGFQPVQG